MIDIITLVVFLLIALAVFAALLVTIKDLIHILYLYYVECKIYNETQHPELFWTDLDFARMKKAHDCRVTRKLITRNYLN
jgi:hypothetical protein